MKKSRILIISLLAPLLICLGLWLWFNRAPMSIDSLDTSDSTPSAGAGIRDTDLAAAMSKNTVATGQESAAVLQQHAAVYGTVHDADSGNPVPNASVIITIRNNKRTASTKEKIELFAVETTDDEGQFRFQDVPPGTHMLMAHTEQKISFSQRKHIVPLTIDAADQVVGPIALNLVQGRQLLVLVTDAITKQPVEGANLDLGSHWPLTKKTDASGRATYVLSGEAWRLSVQAPGYAKVHSLVQLSEAPMTLHIALEPGFKLHGTVKNTEGNTLADVPVSLWSRDFQSLVRSDREGRYQFHSLPKTVDIFLAVQTRDHTLYRKTIHTGPLDESLQHHIILSPKTVDVTHFVLSGWLKDQLDQPIAGGEITMGSRNNAHTVVSDERGWFQFEDVSTTSNWQYLQATAPGYAYRTLYLKNRPTEPLTMVMEPGHQVAGVVQNEAGEPISHANLKLVRPSGHPYFGGKHFSVDETGRFHIDSVPKDALATVWAANHSKLESMPIQMDFLDHQFTLPPEGVIEGFVMNSKNEAVESFNIRLTGNRNMPQSNRNLEKDGIYFTSSKGWFQIRNLNIGNTYKLLVKAPDHGLTFFEDLKGAQAGEDPQTLILKDKTISVRGSVHTEQGEVIAGARIQILVYRDENQMQSRYAMPTRQPGPQASLQIINGYSDTHGRFAMDNLPGQYPLRMVVETNDFQHASIDHLEKLPHHKRKNLAVVLQPSARIYGQINKDVFPGQIMIGLDQYRGREPGLSETTVADTYAFSNLEAGTYGISVLTKTRANHFNMTYKKTIEIHQGEQRQFDIGFEPRHDLNGVLMVNQKPLANATVVVSSRGEIQGTLTPVVTASDGSFQITNLEDGPYILGYLRSLSLEQTRIDHNPAKTRPFTMAGSDLFQTFHFEEQTTVTGRIIPIPPYSARVQLVKVDGDSGHHFSPDVEVGLNGRFVIEQVLPGSYALNLRVLEGTNHLNVGLLDHLEIPFDQPMVDLGDIPVNLQGQFRIHLENAAALPNQHIRLQVRPSADPGNQMRRSSTMNLVHNNGVVLVEDLPLGQLMVKAEAQNEACFILPLTFEVFLEPNAMPTVNLRVEAQTVFLADLTDQNRRFQDIAMTHLDSGQTLPLVLNKPIQKPDGLNLALHANFLRVKGVEPGGYLLEITFEDGSQTTDTVVLTAGKLVRANY